MKDVGRRTPRNSTYNDKDDESHQYVKKVDERQPNYNHCPKPCKATNLVKGLTRTLTDMFWGSNHDLGERPQPACSQLHIIPNEYHVQHSYPSYLGLAQSLLGV